MSNVPVLVNKHGTIPVETKVHFWVENQSQWIGGNTGILFHDGKEFLIQTPYAIVTIGKGYDAYLNTIEPIRD